MRVVGKPESHAAAPAAPRTSSPRTSPRVVSPRAAAAGSGVAATVTGVAETLVAEAKRLRGGNGAGEDAAAALDDAADACRSPRALRGEAEAITGIIAGIHDAVDMHPPGPPPAALLAAVQELRDVQPRARKGKVTAMAAGVKKAVDAEAAKDLLAPAGRRGALEQKMAALKALSAALEALDEGGSAQAAEKELRSALHLPEVRTRHTRELF